MRGRPRPPLLQHTTENDSTMSKARVICTLPFASTEISGVAFAEDRGQMVSAEIEEDRANLLFAGIPGFKILPAKADADAAARAAAGAEEAAPAAAEANAKQSADANGDGKVTAAERRAAAKKE